MPGSPRPDSTTTDEVDVHVGRIPSRSARLLHVGGGLGSPTAHSGSPFRPRATEPGRRATALIRGLRDRGAVQAVVTSTRQIAPIAAIPGVRQVAMRGDDLPLVAGMRTVRAASRRVDAVHLHLDGRHPLVGSAAATLGADAPLIVHLAGSTAAPTLTGGSSSTRGRVVDARIETELLHRAALVVAPTRRLAELARAAGADRVELVPPAVLVGDDGPSPATAPPPRPPLMLDRRHDAPTIVTVGALSRRWSQSGLLAILAAVPDVRMVVLRDGSTRAATLARATALGVADRLRIHRRVRWCDVEQVVAAADLVVSTPNAGEDPAALLLAQAAGRPVVATATDGIEALVSDGVDGVLVPAADDDALVGATRALLSDPDRAVALGQAAARRSAVRTWEVVAAAVASHTDAALRAT